MVLGIKLYTWFVNRNNPWFLRGNGMNYGTGTGVFAFNNTDGTMNGNRSFRVLTMIIRNKIWD